jgi:ribosomal peptide maturation radical SAM protein 1
VTGNDRERDDVVWLCPPWQAPNRGNLGLALISATVRDVVRSRSLFANLRFARQIGEDLYGRLQATRFTGEALFTPAAFGLEGPRLDAWLERAVPVMREETGLDDRQIERLVGAEVPAWVGEITADVAKRRPATVGISLLVSQVVASLAIARALKSAAVDTTVVVGGSAAFGPMGVALLESFEAFDVAVTGDGQRSIVELLRRLRDGGSLADVAGIAYRDGTPDRRVRRNPGGGLDRLDDLPVPDYSDFVAQHRESGLTGDLWLPFESSRGCWWGEHTICTFCGLNAESVTYRRKSPTNVVDELRRLHSEHGIARFCATDNILPADADRDLLPALAQLRQTIPDLRIYYQMKSNVSRRLLAGLVGAGVSVVQPGIESFNDNILRLMRKGATGLSQIRALKLMTEAGIDAIYGILHGTIGERADDLREQVALIPALHHLVPPAYCSPISLDRFSPYAEAPAEYGIELLPPDHSELMFPDAGVDRLGIAGAFGVRRTTVPDPALDASVAELRAAVARWQESYRPGLCTATVLPGPVVHIRDQRDGSDRRLRLEGNRARVFLATDLVGSLRVLARRERLDLAEVVAAADWLAARRLIVRRRDRALAVPTMQRRPAVIGLTGLPGAGKSFLLETARAMGVACLDVGALIRLKFGDDAYHLAAADKVELLGKSDSVFRSLGPELRDACPTDGVLLIDSFKAAADLDVVREELPDAVVESLLITASRGRRRRRFAARARPDDGPSLEAKEESLRAIGIGAALRSATWELRNDATTDQFRHQIHEFLQSVVAGLAWPEIDGE